jgi:hypothetical protein
LTTSVTNRVITRMPRPGTMWRHVIISTRRSWLHGDPRGFRSRGHRIHSSGDYKDPPPPGEHEGLLKYQQKRARGPVVKIPKQLRREVGLALLLAGYRVLVIAVTRKHAHVLEELPQPRRRVVQVVGTWKAARTSAVRKTLPGSIWGEGGKFKPVRNREHLRRAFKYIRDDQGAGAWVWTYRDGVPQEVEKALERVLRDRARAKSKPKNPKPRAQRSECNERRGAPDVGARRKS